MREVSCNPAYKAMKLATTSLITAPSPEDLIKVMMNVREIPSQKVIGDIQKSCAHEIIDMVITAMSEIFKEHHEGKQLSIEESARLSNYETLEDRHEISPNLCASDPKKHDKSHKYCSTGNQSNNSESGLRKHMEKVRQERAKIEIISTACDANDNMKD